MPNVTQVQQGQPVEYSGTRRWTRYAVSLSLRVRVPTVSGHEFMLAHGRDISQGGMAVYVPVDLEIGQPVLMQLIFPSMENPVTLQAAVKNRMGFKYGVEFIEPALEQQEIILINLHKLLASTSSG